MMDINEICEALTEFTGGRTTFEPDADGIVHAGIDGVVSLFLAERNGTLVMWAEIGTLPEDESEANRVMKLLLDANFMGRGTDGGAMSLLDRQLIHYHKTVSLEGLDLDGFHEELELFLGVCLQWQRALIESPSDAAEVSPEQLEDTSGFMRV